MKTLKKARVEIMKTQKEPVMVVEFFVERRGRKYVKLVVTGRYELYGPKELFNLIKKHPDQKFRITRRVFVNPQNLSETLVEEFADRLWNLQM